LPVKTDVIVRVMIGESAGYLLKWIAREIAGQWLAPAFDKRPAIATRGVDIAI